jgi:hypothetical protein
MTTSKVLKRLFSMASTGRLWTSNLWRIVLLGFGSVFIVSCSPKKSSLTEAHLNKTYFDSMDGAPPFVPGNFETRATLTLSSKKRKQEENLQLRVQYYQNYRVEGTYLKEISSLRGKKRFQASAFFEPDKNLKLEMADLDSKQKILSRMHRAMVLSQNQTLLSSEPEKKIVWIKDSWKPVFAWTSVDSQGDFWTTLRDSEFKEVRHQRLGSGFVDQHKAFLYPESPVRTQIEEVSLGFLSEDPHLENERVSLTTESQSKAVSKDTFFKYQPEEDEFDQVQAFYFASRFLSWIESSFQIGLKSKLQIETQVGYPQKTNTMFYYDGRVRLGSGDGISFDQVMKDPSIVMHEAAHFFIDQMAGLPFQGEGGSINEGLADALAAIHLKSPFMGEASYKKQLYKRSLDNHLRVQDRTGKLYADSLIVSGTFWKMYQSYGQESTQQVIFYILERLHPGSNFQHLQNLLQEAIVVLGPGRSSYNEILREKGWLDSKILPATAGSSTE